MKQGRKTGIEKKPHSGRETLPPSPFRDNDQTNIIPHTNWKSYKKNELVDRKKEVVNKSKWKKNIRTQ